MKPVHKTLLPCISGLAAFAGIATSHAATIVAGDVTSTLGPNFFLDAAATGGNDFAINQPGTALFRRSFGTLNVGSGGTTITITGIGWASPNSATNNDATSATVAIRYLGADGIFGGTDDVLIGTVTDNYTFGGASEYVWEFDTPMTAVIDGLNSFFRVEVSPINGAGNGSFQMKTTSGTDASAVKLSVAGTSVAVVPEPSAALLGAMGALALLRRQR